VVYSQTCFISLESRSEVKYLVLVLLQCKIKEYRQAIDYIIFIMQGLFQFFNSLLYTFFSIFIFIILLFISMSIFIVSNAGNLMKIILFVEIYY